MTGTFGAGTAAAFGVVLCIPCLGGFIWHFAVAGLGLRYLLISFMLMCGHLFRNPCQVAFNRVDIFGLHNNWCTNFTLLARICTECKNKAPSYTARGGWGAQLIPGQGRGKSFWLGVVRIPFFVIGRVLRSVAGSLYPRNITLPLYTTSHFSLSKMTVQLTLHSGRMPISEAIFRSGMMCPVRVIGKPGIFMLHTCVDLIFLPSKRLTVSGFVAICLFSTSTPSMTKMDVAPVSATARFVVMVIVCRYCGFGLPYKILANAANDVGCDCLFLRLLVAKLDVTTVASSSPALVTTLMTSVGSGK
jgi:hypothetical protein